MKKLGLLGYPLSHSFSSKYFTQKFETLGIPAYYENLEWPSLENLKGRVLEAGLEGFNVTIPYKTAIMPLLDELSPEAEAVGAVNTVKVLPGGILRGYNTDIFGFAMSLKPYLQSHHQMALVFGSGGASRAVQYVFRQLGIDFKVVSRDPGIGQLGYDQLNQYVFRYFRLLVNTTPVGMFPDVEDSLPLPWDFLDTGHLAYDLIYNPDETVFLREAAARGALTMNGMAMLKLQAEKAWEIWSNDAL